MSKGGEEEMSIGVVRRKKTGDSFVMLVFLVKVM